MKFLSYSLLLFCLSSPLRAASNCEYKVISIEGVKTIVANPPTVNFKDGKIFGSASCNNYQASFEKKDGHIKVGPGMSTLMACSPQDVMSQESHFLKVLPQVSGESKTSNGIIFLDKNFNKLFEVENCS